LNAHQDKNTQNWKFGELVKQSSRNEGKLIVGKIAKTLNMRQDKHSQILKFGEPAKQSSRNRRKLFAVEIA
jgi:hypothetical protein